MRRIVKTFNAFLNENAQNDGTTDIAPGCTPEQIAALPKGLVFYDSSNTPQGGTTPTGQSNKFSNNMFGKTEQDVYAMACQFKFRTDNNTNFQTDLLSYVKKNHPDVEQKMLQTFGQTAAGDFVDGLLGARTMFVIAEISKKNPPAQNLDAYITAFQGGGVKTTVGYSTAGPAGLARTMTRDSKSLTDSGVPTSPQENHPDIEFVFVHKDSWKPDPSKGLYRIPHGVWTNQIVNIGNSTIEGQDRMNILLKYKVNGANSNQAAQQINNAASGGQHPTTGGQTGTFDPAKTKPDPNRGFNRPQN